MGHLVVFNKAYCAQCGLPASWNAAGGWYCVRCGLFVVVQSSPINNKDKWHRRFLQLADMVASWSKDVSTQCGAVITRPDKTVCSVGFNGFPRGCNDKVDYYKDREFKYTRIIHAELNAILHTREPLHGYTMYTSPGGIGPTCDRCAAHVIQSGITKVVHKRDKSNFTLRWKDAAERGLDMYKEAGVEVVTISA